MRKRTYSKKKTAAIELLKIRDSLKEQYSGDMYKYWDDCRRINQKSSVNNMELILLQAAQYKIADKTDWVIGTKAYWHSKRMRPSPEYARRAILILGRRGIYNMYTREMVMPIRARKKPDYQDYTLDGQVYRVYRTGGAVAKVAHIVAGIIYPLSANTQETIKNIYKAVII